MNKTKSIDRPLLSFDAINAAGAGVALWEGREIAVEGLFPEEIAKVEITSLSRHHRRGTAKLLKRNQDHPGRRESLCVHHRRIPEILRSESTDLSFESTGSDHSEVACTGCPLMELDYASQLSVKKDYLRRAYGLELEEIVGRPEQEFGYRHSAKRVVSGKPGDLQLGSYVHESHRLAKMDHCVVDHPRIVEVLLELKRIANLQLLVPYNEIRNQGDLRYVWCKTNGQEVLLNLVAAKSNGKKVLQSLADALRLPHGVAWSLQSGAGNAMQGQAPQWLYGGKSFSMKWDEHEVEVGPSDFVQPNPPVAAMAYKALIADSNGRPKTGQLAYDLYAGTGLTTRWLVEQFSEVKACELHAGCLSRAEIVNMSAESFLATQIETLSQANPLEGRRPDLIVANPPRSGLGLEVCQHLLEIAAPCVHIMSCHPRSLIRDLKWLAPHYELQCVRGYDTLPQTPHVELVAWLQLRGDVAY